MDLFEFLQILVVEKHTYTVELNRIEPKAGFLFDDAKIHTSFSSQAETRTGWTWGTSGTLEEGAGRRRSVESAHKQMLGFLTIGRSSPPGERPQSPPSPPSG